MHIRTSNFVVQDIEVGTQFIQVRHGRHKRAFIILEQIRHDQTSQYNHCFQLLLLFFYLGCGHAFEKNYLGNSM